MGRFYIRVFKDGNKERTWGCGSRGENNQHYKDYISSLLTNAEAYSNNPTEYSGPTLGKFYKLELIKNRHGEKELYREMEIELIISESKQCGVSYIKRNDITYITEGFDPRVLVLPPDW